MLKRAVMSVVLLCAILPMLEAGEATGPPAPVPYREIPDPPDNAVRHITVKAADRGAVWLLTGLLSGWSPDIAPETIARLKPRHWRQETWPIWYPVSITEARNKGRKAWGDYRDSPEQLGMYFETMMRLQARGMTWQPVLHHKGRYYGRYHIPKDMLDDFYKHLFAQVSYCRTMGVPFDYYEICNEPGGGHAEGVYEDVKGYTFKGTWAEFLGMWDTAYKAIRDAYPEAKIVGPSYSRGKNLEPFLDHCKENGQRLDVLSWHFPSKVHDREKAVEWIVPDAAHRQIEANRKMVQEKYPSLGIEAIHIDEWGQPYWMMGPGTAMAIIHYLDLAGVHRAAKSTWTEGLLNGLLVDYKTMTPRTSYWCWAEYAKQDKGVRLVTETNDRGVVAMASRHDDQGIVRALVTRSQRYCTQFVKNRRKGLVPVKTTVDLEGLPIEGRAEVTIMEMGPYNGPVWAEDLESLTTRTVMTVVDGKLSVVLDEVQEDQVYSIAIGKAGKGTKPALPADPEAVAGTEDFSAYEASEDWKPAAGDGWVALESVKRDGSRMMLSKKHGRRGTIGLGGMRKGKPTSSAYWRVNLNREVNTLRCYVKATSGVEIYTQRGGVTAGLLSVGGYTNKIMVLQKGGGNPVGVELVSKDKFQANHWYKLELQHDFDAGKQRARIDDGQWTAWIPMLNDGVTATSSVHFYTLIGSHKMAFAIDDLATYHLETDGQ